MTHHLKMSQRLKSLTRSRIAMLAWAVFLSVLFNVERLPAQPATLAIQSVKHQPSRLTLPAKASDSVGVSMTINIVNVRPSHAVDLEVTLTPDTAPSTTQERFELIFQTSSETTMPRSNAAQVRVPLTLEEGSKGFTKKVSLPCFALAMDFEFELRRSNGEKLEGYNAVVPNPHTEPTDPLGDYLTRQCLKNISTLASPEDELEDWTNHQIETWIVEVSEIKALKKSSTKEKLIEFLMRGGCVYVNDPDATADRLRDLGIGIHQGESEIRTSNGLRGTGIEVFALGPGQIALDPKGDSLRSIHKNTVEFLVGMRKNSKPSKRLLAIFGPRLIPAIASGVEPMLGDRHNRDWIVRGVAQPPVYSFMGILTAFVILVGPVAYRLTTKSGRGYMMFLIAPILALICTISMFVYGIMSDGFGTIARIRQISVVDGISGTASERVRGTYFAGIRPSNGLRFPANADVLIYPQPGEEGWETRIKMAPSQLGQIKMSEEEIRFDSDFLPSRNQGQFVYSRLTPKLGALIVEAHPDESGAPKLTNEFDFALRQVTVCDADGNYWHCDQIEAGQTVVPRSPVDDKESNQIIASLYTNYAPMAEVSFVRAKNRYKAETRGFLSSIANNYLGESNRVEGTYESFLNDRLKSGNDLPRSYFVSIADVSEEAIAIEGAELADSVRYVLGTTRNTVPVASSEDSTKDSMSEKNE